MSLNSVLLQTYRTTPRTLEAWVRSEGNALKLVYENVRRLMTEGKFDWITGIEGRTGFGKSTLAKKIASYSVAVGGRIQTVYDMLDLLVFMQNAKPGDVVIYDEGANGMFSRQATSIENQAFVLVMMTARARRVHVIIIIPNRDWFDIYLRGDSVRFMLHVTELGKADLYAVTGPPKWPGDKGRYVFTHSFEDMSEAEKNAYEPDKMAFIDAMIQKQIDRLQKKRDPDYVSPGEKAREEGFLEEVIADKTRKAVLKDQSDHSTSRNPSKLEKMKAGNRLSELWACPVPRCPYPGTTWAPAKALHTKWHMIHGDRPQGPSSQKARDKVQAHKEAVALRARGVDPRTDPAFQAKWPAKRIGRPPSLAPPTNADNAIDT